MRALLIFSLLLFSTQAFSKQLVLIQGYLGSSSSWVDSGVTQQLKNYGWHYGGKFYYGSDGARVYQKTKHKSDSQRTVNTFYQVELPTEASIQNQAYFLTAYVTKLRSLFPHQAIVLAGHSAGGVVARYVMVRKPGLKISQLITIASPHLGTDSAEFGKMVGDSPLAMIAPMIGAGTLNRSQALYTDLLPESPHRFLYWLNRQPHPDAEYISIVRDKYSPEGGDLIVPEKSQYLENVHDIKYRANSYIVQGSHSLTSADGLLLLDLINERVIRPL